MGSLKDIYSGWKAYLINDPIALELAKERAVICSGCDKAEHGTFEIILPDFQIKEIQGLVCSKKKGGCGCPISTATRSKNYKCPVGKW